MSLIPSPGLFWHKAHVSTVQLYVIQPKTFFCAKWWWYPGNWKCVFCTYVMLLHVVLIRVIYRSAQKYLSIFEERDISHTPSPLLELSDESRWWIYIKSEPLYSSLKRVWKLPGRSALKNIKSVSGGTFALLGHVCTLPCKVDSPRCSLKMAPHSWKPDTRSPSDELSLFHLRLWGSAIWGSCSNPNEHHGTPGMAFG